MNTTPPLLQMSHVVPGIALSRQGMLNVINYSPRMGRGGTTITVDTLFINTLFHDDVRIRIVVGHKPVPTGIKYIGGQDNNLWRCTGSVPEFDVHKIVLTQSVNVTIQAVDERNSVLDTVTFGYFTYQEHGKHRELSARAPHRVSLSTALGSCLPDTFHEGSTHFHAIQPPTTRPVLFERKAHVSPARFRSRGRKQTAAKHKRVLRRPENNHDGEFLGVSLDFSGDLKELGYDLSAEERRLKRRLVRFICKPDGDTLHISFHVIQQEEYDERFVVVSCIYREDTCDTCYTSVDMIRLVEYLVQAQFTAEEKSRIRRNLESLSPKTIQKEEGGLFKTLMGFPAPQPRTIEKDIKVFDWNTIASGISKVIEKYAWVTVTLSSRARSPRPAVSRLPSYTFHDASPQPPPPYLHDALASFDGRGHTSDTHKQANLVPAMHVNPSWLHSQDSTIDSQATGPFAGRDVPLFPSPRVYPEVSDNNQMFSHYGPFHHFDSLELQTTLRDYNAHAGMTSPFF
ncbi:hypothetical protein BC827DRAFT_1154380 [Russula dissimulans]|nr:hypothetical protein BC827DRAFT_1154380 [Russula dissimulans]